MTENIKHMRQIIENNDLTNDMTRAEASVVLDLIEAEFRDVTNARLWLEERYDALCVKVADLEGTIGNALT